MVESALITTIYLLFFGLVFVTIINVALIIALAILLSKQLKNKPFCFDEWMVYLNIISATRFVLLIFYLYYTHFVCKSQIFLAFLQSFCYIFIDFPNRGRICIGQLRLWSLSPIQVVSPNWKINFIAIIYL